MQLTEGEPSTPQPGCKISVNVVSAQYLTPGYSPNFDGLIDPFVEIILSSGEVKEQVVGKTKLVRNNGFNPIFNENFEINVPSPEISMLTFTVKKKDEIRGEECLAYSSIPITCLRPGFRTIGLHDMEGKQHGDFEFSSLFVKIHFDLLG